MGIDGSIRGITVTAKDRNYNEIVTGVVLCAWADGKDLYGIVAKIDQKSLHCVTISELLPEPIKEKEES